MNLVKISKLVNDYVESVVSNIPDVYECFKHGGIELMGRNIYKYEEVPDKNKEYFRKPIIHKQHQTGIGVPLVNWYAEDIIEINKEQRAICVKGNANKYQETADKIIKLFNNEYKDFVFDVGFSNEKLILVELNEIQLSTISKEEFNFILENLL